LGASIFLISRNPQFKSDLAEFHGLTDWERAAFLLVLEWFELKIPGLGQLS